MNDAERHIVKARDSLAFARYALAGAYTEEARAANLHNWPATNRVSAGNRYRFSVGAMT